MGCWGMDVFGTSPGGFGEEYLLCAHLGSNKEVALTFSPIRLCIASIYRAPPRHLLEADLVGHAHRPPAALEEP